VVLSRVTRASEGQEAMDDAAINGRQGRHYSGGARQRTAHMCRKSWRSDYSTGNALEAGDKEARAPE